MRGLALILLGVTLGAILGLGCSAPPRPESHTPFELGRKAASVKDYSTAISQLSVAVNNARDYVFTTAYLERGDCYLKVGTSAEDLVTREQNLKNAIEDFNLVLKQPELLLEEKARALVLRGKTLLVGGNVKEAEESFLGIIGIELGPSDVHYRLEAHRELGWILLESARGTTRREETAEEEILRQDNFRSAQDHFSRGLEIDADEEDCNLGKGICLHSRGQDREALSFLAKCVSIAEARGTPNPRGHYYFALALELQKGFQEKALEHYRKAVEQDALQAFTPLYSHLVKVLLVYVPFEDPQFRWFLDKMLSYGGDDRDYWESVEALAARLAADSLEARKESGVFARALARARNRKVAAAVEDALLLRDLPNFLDLLSRIFPNRSKRSDYLYGRALTLLGAKKHAELEAFFEDGVFHSPEPALLESDHYQSTLVLEGKNIVARWLENRSSTTPLSPQEKLERDRTLGRARDAFRGFLEKHAEDQDVAMALGEVQELLEAFPAAFLSYALIAREVPDHTEAFRRIQKLHSGRLLPAKDLTEAWIVLRGYAGQDEEIREYLRRTQIAIQADALLYCRGCGRKGAEGDLVCVECGRQIGQALDREPPSFK